jgi:hypothetical protein
MLWAALDDSAIHARGSAELHRYALGGGVATTEIWKQIKLLWRARLTDPGNPSNVEWFHYKEWKRAFLGHAKPGGQFLVAGSGTHRRQNRPPIPDR